MLRAKIARQAVQLIGCDQMPCAEFVRDFAPFDGEADCCVDVTVCESLSYPTAYPFESVGDWRVVAMPDGTRAACHRGGVIVRYDEAVTHTSIVLHEDMPDRDTVQYLQVMHAVSRRLQRQGGLLLHSAALSIDGAGIALCGRSGVGKSTLAHLVSQAFPSTTVLCEESPAVMEENGGFVLYGTPFCGKDRLHTNECAPLRAIVLLRQAPHNALTEPKTSQIMQELLRAVTRAPYAPEEATLVTDRLIRLIETTPIFGFENDGTAAAVSYLITALRERGCL